MSKLAEERKYISQLNQLLCALNLGMQNGVISPAGIAEIYIMLSDYRRAIHFDHEEKLKCGCEELRQEGNKNEG